MTKEEQNQTIKDKWVEHLQREDNIPESVGEIYRNWLLGKIQQASEQLRQPANSEGDQRQGEQGAEE